MEREKYIPFSENLGSGFLVYNFIFTQVDEICKNKLIGVKRQI
jgi:hypothetical protein